MPLRLQDIIGINITASQDCHLTLAEIWQRNPIEHLMTNVQADLVTYQLDKNKGSFKLVATAINSKNTLTKTNIYANHNNCFVISPYANLVNYAKDELHKLPTVSRYASLGLIHSLSKVISTIDIDKVQVLANCLMATNIITQEFQQIDINKLTLITCEHLPYHTLMIRSLNEHQHSDFIQRLKTEGWLPVVNRQVYVIDDWKKASKRRDYKRDIKLLADTNYSFEQVTESSSQYFQGSKQAKWQIAINLYNQLYLDKYSMENVHFTAVYLRELVQAKLCKLYLLYDKKLAKYVGMVVTMNHENTMTIPMVGYDTKLPQSKAIYRRVMMFAINKACTNNHLLHISAGAPQFKRHRGAEPTLEYMMVYVDHLPKEIRVKGRIENKLKKIMWRVLSQLSVKYYAPILQKLEL